MPRPPSRKASTRTDIFDQKVKIQHAVGLHHAGRLDDAQAAYEKLLTEYPQAADGFHLLGVLAYQRKQPRQAVDLIRRAIKLDAKAPSYHSNLGLALHDLGRLDAAVKSFDVAIGLAPGSAEIHYNRGNTLKALNQAETALQSYDMAIALKPGYADAYSARGLALHDLKRFDAAIMSYDLAIAHKPTFAEAYANRGNVHLEQQNFAAALADYDAAIALKRSDAGLYSNRALALQTLNRPEEALQSCDKALSLDPGFAIAYRNRGNALLVFNRLDEAVGDYEKAIALAPDDSESYWNKALVKLLQGDFETGWRLYEWRWKRRNFPTPKRNFRQPLWRGEPSLAGKTLLLHSEQGFGDTIQFCRYAPLAAKLGARVILEVERPLKSLVGLLEGVEQVVGKGADLPAFDYHCPLMSLPFAFKTTQETIPFSARYLKADATKRAHWAEILGAKTRPRVGLAWRGNPSHKNDHNRSLALSALAPWLPEGIDYVSLLKDLADEDRQTLKATPQIRNLGEGIQDFSDTAALCAQMDLVVSVDTSVAHLSAALGQPTWILLPFNPDWRWLLQRNDSPWYDSVRLFRQSQRGDWSGVLSDVHQAIRGEFNRDA